MATTHPMLSHGMLAVLKASRPVGWCFGPILFGIGLIHSRSIPKKLTSLLATAAHIFSLSFPLCTIVFGMNDVYDYDSDVRNPRKVVSGLEGSVLLPVYHPSVRLTAQLSTIHILLTSLTTARGSQNILATTLLVFLAWQYSAPPLRLKEVPLVDSLSNGLIVFLAWFIGYTFGGGRLATAPGKGYTLALCTSGVHALGAVVDVSSDIAAGQKTIATFLGPPPAVVSGALAYAIALSWEKSASVFGVYLWGGFIIMATPCLRLQWAHYAFKSIVYWTGAMSMVWFGSKAFTTRR